MKAGAPLVVMVAALVGHKDPLTFVRAMDVARRIVPNVQALMVGEGESGRTSSGRSQHWGSPAACTSRATALTQTR